MFRPLRSRGLAALAVFILLLTGCPSAPLKTELPDRDESLALTWTEARSRAERLSQIQYTLQIDLSSAADFRGESQITFELSDASQPIRLDFFEGQVESMRLNGTDLPLALKKKYWIELPREHLRTGSNQIEIRYRHLYARDGQGLHRFQDPESGQTFLYTQFETFDANRFMPCFDQPDLRATLQLSVIAPAAWQVVSTTRETRVENTAGDLKRWEFPVTPRIATYLFSLIAGPYQVWVDEKPGEIPLRLMARPSLARHVDAARWFQITRQGFRFYQNYFGITYPFGKYDQILVPEFNAGAMENVAAVTFSEVYLSRSQMTRPQWRRLATTILHEMAHMWFGDLVTMKWWNDLWLNESFATYMASLAMQESTEFKEAWADFFANAKSSAYIQDSLVTTHPIEAPVKNVREAFATFDSITYGKGASTLKQMSTLMGAEAFRQGVSDYLKKYAGKNAELADFIASLQAHTSRNLSVWSDRWLRQTGVDRVTTDWSCDGPRLKQIRVIQTASTDAKFRPQKFAISLHRLKGRQLPVGDVVWVDLIEPRVTLSGDWACPDFLYPNWDDHGYFDVVLDEKSLQTLKTHLSGVEPAFLRHMLWSDLWRMVRALELPLKEYVRVVRQHFPGERDELIERKVVDTVSGLRNEVNTVIANWPVATSAQRQAQTDFVAAMEENYLQRFQRARPGQDAQRFWFDSYVRIARTRPTLDRLAGQLEEKTIGPRFAWDLDRQWDVARRLARFDHPQATAIAKRIAARDNSDRGRKAQLSTEASLPRLEIKQKWVNQLKVAKPDLSFQDARAVLGSLFPWEQASLARGFESEFYEYLRRFGNADDESFVAAFAAALLPLHCEAAESAKLKSWMDGGTPLTPAVRKYLLSEIEEDERCQKIRAQSLL